MSLNWKIALAILFLSQTSARAQDPPQRLSTARELYVSCFLMVKDAHLPRDVFGNTEPFGAQNCMFSAAKALSLKGGLGESGDRFRFCLPSGAEFSLDPFRSMALAYIEFYEQFGAEFAADPGNEVLVVAMVNKWPCEA